MTLQQDIDVYAADGGWLASSHLVAKIAAGLERDKIIIDRADVPRTVQDLGNGQYRMDGSVQTVDEDLTAADAWQEGLEFLALALHLEARESEAAALEARRDELTAELTGIDGERYNSIGVGTILRKSIDRIIELEDQVRS